MITDSNFKHDIQTVGTTVVTIAMADVNHFVIMGSSGANLSITFDGSTPDHSGNGFIATGSFGFSVDIVPEIYTGEVKLLLSGGSTSVIVNGTMRQDVPRPEFNAPG